VNRLPLPLRQIFGVRKGRNPKGIANFIRGYAIDHRLAPTPQKEAALRALADWLLTRRADLLGAYSGKGMAWGYHFPWQSPGFFAPRHSPNCIVTTFCGEALLAAYQATGETRYLEGAKGACTFILEGLPVLEDTDETLCIGYVPVPLRWKVININSVSAGFLAKVAAETKNAALMAKCRRLIQWVVRARMPSGAWNYTEPKSQSGIGPDNYHTGGILDGILDYMTCSGDRGPIEAYRTGLALYERSFFSNEGAPYWREHKPFPHDVHGSAQGAITFSKAASLVPGSLDTAGRILNWAILHLQDPRDGHFHYQKYRLFTWKLNLMRWNNSWMFLAMQEWRRAKAQELGGVRNRTAEGGR